MFAYCNNNPVNAIDSNGRWPRWISEAVALAAATVAIVAACTGNIPAAYASAKIAVTAATAYTIQTFHYDERAANNVSLPQTYAEAVQSSGADLSVDASCHQYTSPTNENTKVCWDDGREAIYDKEGMLVTDSRDVGTYNVFVPHGLVNIAGHIVADMLPWIVFGNDDADWGPVVNGLEKWRNSK